MRWFVPWATEQVVWVRSCVGLWAWLGESPALPDVTQPCFPVIP